MNYQIIQYRFKRDILTHLSVQVGASLPSVELHQGTPATKVNIKDLFAGKKGILFAVPGAFTPSCSVVGTHLLL